MSTPTPPPSLTSLPPELHLAILPFVHYASLTSLRAVNRHFLGLIPLGMIPAARQSFKKHLILTEKAKFREQWNPSDIAWDVSHLGIKNHVCYMCLEEKLSSQFTEKQVIKKRGRGGPHAIKRFCIDCGIKSMWKGGTVIRSWRDLYIICVACKELKLIVALWRSVHWSVCLDCWAQSGGKDGVRVEGLGVGNRVEAEAENQRQWPEWDLFR